MNDQKGIKVILLGESGVGKTNLINITANKQFNTYSESNISNSFTESKVEYNNKEYSYLIWDTVGQEKYRAFNRLFIKGSKIIIIVFAVNNENSFKEVEFWLNYAKENVDEKNYILALVGNKNDLFEEVEVQEDKVQEIADRYKIKYILTSAKIEPEVFKDFLNSLLIEYIEKIGPDEEKKLNFKLLPVKKEIKKKNNFC